MAAGPPAVNLRSAANFTIIAETGVTNVATSAITGNIGLSPTAATAITGSSLVMDPSGTFSTSTQVTGKIYAASYASPTPSMLTTAIGDMQTAYLDASGRTLPDFVNLGSGEIGGLTLQPGLYQWTTGVTVSSAPTFSGGSTDTWILQVAGTLNMASGQTMLLAGGANPQNIVWAVASGVTLGTTSHFEGVLLGKTGITVETGGSMNGRALAQTLVALQQATLVPP